MNNKLNYHKLRCSQCISDAVWVSTEYGEIIDQLCQTHYTKLCD